MKTMHFNNLEDIEKYLYDFKIIFAYHSAKIENDEISYHDTRDIFEKGKLSAFSGDLKTVFEIKNQKDCYEFLKPFIIEKKPLDIEFIKKLHYKLTKGTYDDERYNIKNERPGEFKKHDYVTGIHDVGSFPEDVIHDLKELLEEINDKDVTDFFTAGIYLHARFEYIHPFADGNGRLGRTLMNYYFMIHDIAPVVIREEDRKDYYYALEMYDVHEDLKPLKEFIEKQQERTWCRQNDKRHQKLRELSETFENETTSDDYGFKL